MSFIFYFFFQIKKGILDPPTCLKMPQQCGLKTEEVVDNKQQTEQGQLTVKWMKNCIRHVRFRTLNS